MTLTETPAEANGDDRGPGAGLRRTLRIARPALPRLMLATLLGAAAVGAAIGLLATSAWLISRASQHPSENAIALAVALVQLFALSRGFCRYGERLVGHDASFRVLADLRVRVYEQLERLAPVGLPAFHRGDLLARLVHDVDSLQDLLLRVIPPFVIAALVGTLTVVAVWLMLPAAALILAGALILAATLVPWLTKRLAQRSESAQAVARGELATSVVDLLEGAPDLVAFGAAGTQLDRSAASDRDLTQIASATARTAGIGLGLTTLLAGLAMWGALVVGISAVHAHHLHGVLLAVIVLIPLAAFELVAPLPTATQTLERVRRCAARVFAVLDADAPVTEPDEPTAVPASPRRIQAHGARARYGATLPWALDAVDLELSAGRRIGVVGPSGAGKSTLAAVLLRFLPYDGSVDLEGVELDRLAGDEVRRVVGLVAQDAHLFDTSIGENLRVARRDATDHELHAVLRRVHLQDWVATLPQGLATEVGEHGAELSGGQRQRLAVARALLADFPILVLDEPAEHLDLGTADAITADVLDVTRGRSTLLITHRLAGLEAVDEVLVIDDGQIVERGTHGELLRADGRYATLWRREREAEPPLADSVHPVVLAPWGAGA